MASSDNLMTMMEQPWSFRLPFADAWISDIYTKETDTLTKALQKSFDATSSDGDAFSTEMVESLFAKPEVTPLQTPTASGGSENEAPVSKQRRSVPRAMVQQVTGVRFGGLNGQLPMAPVLKPEPHRVVSRLQPSSALPTLDTSAFLLDGSTSSLVAQLPPPSTVVAEGGATASGLEFESFCSFPTLESWKVM
ncbi:UNVERIFIED_CONTAM: Calmodulin-binding protein 25 [Sesamum latifolium]|uniref:Calmodulin-binding protein 25 n=1 Tax=Sesamum latifolium TaxID=2727402 RepID=A0AAW2XJI1_9LAMI